MGFTAFKALWGKPSFNKAFQIIFKFSQGTAVYGTSLALAPGDTINVPQSDWENKWET